MKVYICPVCGGRVHYCNICDRWECLEVEHHGRHIIPLVTPQEV